MIFGFFLAMVSCRQAQKTDPDPEKVSTSDTLGPALDYSKLGMEYAQATQQVLGSNLMGAMQQAGPVGALEFCNVRAMPLTDSMATKYGARIKRVSDKPRNPINQADSTELAKIKVFKSVVESGDSPVPFVEEKEGDVHFYYPILTNDMCLKCHGTPGKQLVPEVGRTLSERYPHDLATGYDVNQVRGIWSIAFPK